MKNWKTTELKRLANALRSIKNDEDMLNFLRDLCTVEELNEFSRRWQAAELLHRGLSYRNVAKKTGLSTTTVSRIAHWLHHGEGGYLSVLRHLSPPRS